MIVSRFRSVGWVATIATAALGFYLVSQRVATERAKLNQVDIQIADMENKVRKLQTELVARSRLAQLERWNRDVLALSAPEAEQFLGHDRDLMRFESPVKPAHKPKTVQAAAYHPAMHSVPVVSEAEGGVEIALGDGYLTLGEAKKNRKVEVAMASGPSRQ